MCVGKNFNKKYCLLVSVWQTTKQASLDYHELFKNPLPRKCIFEILTFLVYFTLGRAPVQYDTCGLGIELK